MPAFTKSKIDFLPEQGLRVDDSDPVRLDAALELALNYRGDVTIFRRSDGTPVEGYLYDRKRADDPGKSAVRMIPADGSCRLTIPLEEITEIAFTGRDTASGKSFETWMKKYVEKKSVGERAAIESDPLD